MNRQIRRLGLGLLACYIALFAMTNYIQVLRAGGLNDDPRNTRAIVRDFDHERGQIVAADGPVLACTVPAVATPPAAPGDDPCTTPALKVGQFELQRVFPQGDLFGHITGYFNFNFGATGVEKRYNEELAGQTTEQELRSISDLFVDRNRTGDVHLTVRADLQAVARQALGDQRGSVVAIDPRDGSILALWSFPSFDPNPLSAHDKTADDTKTFLEASPDRPLRGSTFQERFFPGSTFKVVTASVGVEAGVVTESEPEYPQLSELDLPQTDRTISNFGGSTCGGTLFDVMKVSCNTAFAQMGLDIGPERFGPGAERFGFNDRPPIDLPAAAASVVPDQSSAALPVLAQSAIGQNDVQATPLEMALVASAIANNGVIMRPHVLADVRDDQGEVIKSFEPEPWKQAVSPQTAQLIRAAMRVVVEDERGTAKAMRIDGVEVAGKTGTAQIEPGNPDAGVERVDHRLRRPAGRRADGGRGRPRRGAARVQRRHRRPGRGPHRQADDRGGARGASRRVTVPDQERSVT